jgi:hypothetical protein
VIGDRPFRTHVDEEDSWKSHDRVDECDSDPDEARRTGQQRTEDRRGVEHDRVHARELLETHDCRAEDCRAAKSGVGQEVSDGDLTLDTGSRGQEGRVY